MDKHLLTMHNITKTFPGNGVKAVDCAELQVGTGEIHSIIGENGAGKSTLMHILAGEIIPDTGNIIISNRNIELSTPSIALKNGIAMLHQHLKLIPELTVLENIILGVEPSTKAGTLNSKDALNKINKLCKEFDIFVDPKKLVKNLTSDKKQITALLSILYHNIKIIILDEPTTFFNEIKADTVHKVIKKLQNMGKSIIIITHKLKEAIEISDSITVMKAGRTIANLNSSETDINHLSSLILDGNSKIKSNKPDIQKGSVLLEFKNITYSQGAVNYLDINFHIKKYETLVVTGIRENGLEILEQILAGNIQKTTGDIIYKNTTTGNKIFSLRKIGAGYIPSDRIKKGTSIKSSITDNIILLKYKFLSKWGIMDSKKVDGFVSKLIDEFGIIGSGKQLISTLSGGNIQRVMIAREIDANPELFIFAEPSKGLDILSKQMIYNKINHLKKKGSGILIISSDIDEAIKIADRILILHNGKEAAALINKNLDRVEIGKIMLGLNK